MAKFHTTDLSAEELELLLYLQEEEGDLLQTETIPTRKPQDDLPLSFTQQRLWFLSQLDVDSVAYNMPWAFRLTGGLNVAALEQSLSEIVRRHEVLRTTFQTITHYTRGTNGQPVQVIAPASQMTLAVIDVTNSPNPEAEIQRLINQEMMRPFSLESDLMLRVLLLRLDPPFPLLEEGLGVRAAQDEHLLLITFHHIAFDGWSMGVFWRELKALYAAAVAGEPSPLPPLPIQYADFAIWQRQWLQDVRLEQQLAYWKKQLRNLPALQLPTDRPRPPVQTFRGAAYSFQLSQALCDELAALSRQEDVTLFMSFLATFNVLLSRYTAQEDIVVGSPIANRNRAEIEHLIGFFVNTLVLRTDLSGNPTFRDTLARVREMTLGAYQHQDMPFEKLVEELSPARDLSQNPLVQVLFAVQNAPQSPYSLKGLSVTVPHFDVQTVRFDLEFHLWPTRTEGFVGQIYVNSDLFDRATISRMIGHFQTLLTGLVANPDKRISEQPILTEAERHQLLVTWNNTTSDYPDLCVHQLFEEQVERTPDAQALLFPIGAVEEEQLTYRELNVRANQLAHYLIAQGVGPDVLVAICVERSFMMVVGVLAILKAGGTYLPLDPEYPKERLAFMLEDSQAPLLLTQQVFIKRFSDYPSTSSGHRQGHLLCLEQATMAQQRLVLTPSEEVQKNPKSKVTASNLGYIIYTSGSTGKPKGIAMPHRALLNLIQWQLGISKLKAPKTLQYSSLSFDASFTDMFMTLCAGGTLVIISEAIKRDPRRLAHFIASNAIEKVNLPVVVLQQLAEVASQEPFSFALKEVLSTAEQLQITPAIRQLFQQLDEATLHNQYGPAETHVVTAFTLTGSPDEWPLLPPIGRPIANTEIYILPRHLSDGGEVQPMPIGVPGELYIGGDGLARGYLNRPALTKAKFIPHPGKKGARLYKTGDLARYITSASAQALSAGKDLGNPSTGSGHRIEFLGRIDKQVKIRGFRIELGEIEALLTQHPQVREAVVIVRTDQHDKRLVAYLVTAKGASRRISTWRRYLSARLPNYMVPNLYVQLDGLVLTPNGKIDRRALPAPDMSRPILENSFVAPRTPLEEKVAAIWAELLHIERVGIHDNFFELGGHSLKATQVVSRIRDTFQIELPLRSLFEQPTVAGLGQQIGTIKGDHILPPIVPVGRKSDLPLSFAQERLWFEEQLQGPSPTYNMPLGWRLSGQLNVDALERSLQKIVQRHASLRTTIQPSTDDETFAVAQELAGRQHEHEAPVEADLVHSGAPRQVIQAAHFSLDKVDLSAMSSVEQAAEVQKIARTEAMRPFNLAQELMIRATLIALGAPKQEKQGARLGRDSGTADQSLEEYLFLCTMHHIASDGWSLRILQRELSTLYSSFVNQQPLPLPALPIQYADYALWQRQQLVSTAMAKQLDYWRTQLTDAPASLELLTDHPRPPVQTNRGASHRLTFSKSLSDAVKRLSLAAGCTLFVTLLAAFKVLLHRYSGQSDILVGGSIAGRNRVELEPLIGFFVNNLIYRSDLSGEPTFHELLQRVHATTIEAYTHQDYPFDQLLNELQIPHDLSRNPLAQVRFAFHQREELDLTMIWPGLQVTQELIAHDFSRYDLKLRLVDQGDTLAGQFSYNRDLFQPDTIARMACHLETLLEGIVANPELKISALPLLTTAERQTLLVGWNQTDKPLPLDRCFHQLFEQQVACTPDAVAVLSSLTERPSGQIAKSQNNPVTLQPCNSATYLTYRELNERANQLAHLLVAQGVGPETVVGLFGRRGLDFLTAMLAIFKAGGAYLPFDPRHPVKRLRQMLQQSQTPLVLCATEFSAVLAEALVGIKPLHDAPQPATLILEERRAQHYPTANLPLRQTPENLAYVIYTSGSTGTPKGAMVEQRGMLNHLYAKISDLQLSAADIIAQTASQSFDISVWQFLAALLVGGQVHILSDEVALNPKGLLQQVDSQKISILETVPSMLRAMLEGDNQSTAIPLKALRWLIPTGEALPPALVNQWLTRYPHIPLLNAYGPTECSDDVTHYAIHQPLPPNTIHTPIGRPIANMRAYVLDQAMQPVPIGVRGDLWIGGIGVGRGYLNDPERTVSAFIEDPFMPQAGARLYKTGDLARYILSEAKDLGNLEFLGRLDHQVKIRGFRIELGEIEFILAQHPAVRECVVVARENEDAIRRLVAYVVPAQAASPTVSLLRSFLSEKLPDTMIPSTFVILERLPLTPNGKIDRRALPAPNESRPELASCYVAPQSALERLLADKWQAILGIEKIGIHDNFFELGGDSIRAAILINQLQQELGEVIYVVALFDAPTIASLANYLQQHYAKAIARVGGITLKHDASLAEPQIDAKKITHFRQLIPPLPAINKGSTHRKNPPAIFILSSPRSGSTLFRVMLGGHPKLFAPPELDLLSFNTLAERKQALSGRFSFRLEGLLRAIMQLQGCQPEEAIQLMQHYESQQVTTRPFYGVLQEWIGQNRILVDKTPAYALDLEILKRAEFDFDQALYIHLLRHPAGMIRSFEEARTAQVFFRYEHPFSARELAELTWLVSHQNILDFFTNVPKSRQYRLKFEDIVTQPRQVMQQISHFLGLEFEDAMWQPYQKQEERMTDGIYPISKMLGDVKFHTHRQIDARVANRWPQEMADSLSELTWQLAERLGYRKPAANTTTPTIKRAKRSAYRMKRSACGTLIQTKKDK